MDLRAYLLEPLNGQIFDACLTAAESGILAGTAIALNRASDLGLSVLSHLPDGSHLKPGICVLSIQGTAEQIARAEEELLGCVGKPSGVATASCRFAALAREGRGSFVAPGRKWPLKYANRFGRLSRSAAPVCGCWMSLCVPG